MHDYVSQLKTYTEVYVTIKQQTTTGMLLINSDMVHSLDDLDTKGLTEATTNAMLDWGQPHGVPLIVLKEPSSNKLVQQQ